MRTIIVENGDQSSGPLYRAALRHVAETYEKAFSAKITARPSRLVVTVANDGQIACAASIRCHDEGFFSQHYMDGPVSEVLGQRTGLKIASQGILEVGSLACRSPFQIYPTLQAVFEWGRARGIGWGLFTATVQIRRLVVRARIQPILLTRAEAARVPDAGSWGTYYDNDPWVCAFRDPSQAIGDPLPQQESA